ncbi:hypothetical protein GWI33_006166 [Rhynchophorus ferrugineus]|uniref:Uncharacterized protein n=1 Tax=Rhynchophorus ferrugineus TaxID=354439 RepID=A0A834IWH2_RHYFE|nr:hypothetical protein GWI33_006166 [Rhynchophorus ferrugineus]
MDISRTASSTKDPSEVSFKPSCADRDRDMGQKRPTGPEEISGPRRSVKTRVHTNTFAVTSGLRIALGAFFGAARSRIKLRACDRSDRNTRSGRGFKWRDGGNRHEAGFAAGSQIEINDASKANNYKEYYYIADDHEDPLKDAEQVNIILGGQISTKFSLKQGI